MFTKSFSVNIPKIMFREMYRDYCETHCYIIPDKNDVKSNAIFNETIDCLWKEYYGDDICAFLNGNLPEYFAGLEWNDPIEVTKAVAIMYIDYCAGNPYFHGDFVDLETYWKDLMRQAMYAQVFVHPMHKNFSFLLNEKLKFGLI